MHLKELDLGQDIKCTCESCKGTGIYKGFTEHNDLGVVCMRCNGNGYYILKLEENTKLCQDEKTGSVFTVNDGLIVGEVKLFDKLQTRNDVNYVIYSTGKILSPEYLFEQGASYDEIIRYEEFRQGKLPLRITQYICPGELSQNYGIPRFDNDCHIFSYLKCEKYGTQECWDLFYGDAKTREEKQKAREAEILPNVWWTLTIKVRKYEHKNPQRYRRAYDTEMPDEKAANVFNPNNIPELSKIQDRIDGAKDAETAYKIFAAYTGNSSGKYTDTFGTDPDVTLFKKKLKHMTRVIYDYPELRGNIGNMRTMDPKAAAVMATDGSVGGRDKIDFSYNAYQDREGDEGAAARAKTLAEDLKAKRYNAPNLDYAGTHEMGHGLASLLPDSGDRIQDLIDQNNGVNEADIIRKVAEDTDVLTPAQKKDIKYYDKNQKIRGKIPVLKGQIDTENSKFFKNKHTSRYGRTAPVEMFAESFHDVYANGRNAKPMSREIVKEYERRQQKLTEKKFNQRKTRGLLRRFMDLFKF